MNENERPLFNSAATGDDGSLAALNIAPDENNKHFNCSETTQQKLINTTFWVFDYIDGVKTKFGESRYLVKIKPERNSPESEAKKFFTNSHAHAIFRASMISSSVASSFTPRMFSAIVPENMVLPCGT